MLWLLIALRVPIQFCSFLFISIHFLTWCTFSRRRGEPAGCSLIGMPRSSRTPRSVRVFRGARRVSRCAALCRLIARTCPAAAGRAWQTAGRSGAAPPVGPSARRGAVAPNSPSRSFRLLFLCADRERRVLPCFVSRPISNASVRVGVCRRCSAVTRRKGGGKHFPYVSSFFFP